MSLDFSTLVEQMIGAATQVLSGQGTAVLSTAKAEMQKIAQRIITIKDDLINGKIKPEDAVDLLEIQKNSARNVMLEVEGLTEIMVQDAINAALKVVSTTVNTVLGFALI